jgi:hypothetical protein
VRPLGEREILIGYRARRLSHQYGVLGYEKYKIGIEMKRLAKHRGLNVDIEVESEHRIYGNAWYRFLGSCRATLGTESGSNVFDEDNTIARLAARYANLAFEDFSQRFLGPLDGWVHMNQISPKVFGAIRLKTALILFEGAYPDIIRPHLHYIPLAKDFSNVEEVFEKLQDLALVQAMTDRAYHDVVETGRYSYETFVQGFDDVVRKYTALKPRARVISIPAMAYFGDRDLVPLWPTVALDGLMSTTILDSGVTRDSVLSAAHLVFPRAEPSVPTADAHKSLRSRAFRIPLRIARRLWRLLPLPAASQDIGGHAEGAEVICSAFAP